MSNDFFKIVFALYFTDMFFVVVVYGAHFCSLSESLDFSGRTMPSVKTEATPARALPLSILLCKL